MPQFRSPSGWREQMVLGSEVIGRTEAQAGKPPSTAAPHDDLGQPCIGRCAAIRRRLLRLDHAPAAQRLDFPVTPPCIGGLDSRARAPPHVEEAVPRHHRTDGNGFEKVIVAGIAAHGISDKSIGRSPPNLRCDIGEAAGEREVSPIAPAGSMWEVSTHAPGSRRTQWQRRGPVVRGRCQRTEANPDH